SVFVYPSLYEGFGYPPLEAMACGVPVITSNTSSLPEVVGDAGIMVDPRDDAALAVDIQRVLEDRDLQATLSRKGLERAARFRWQTTADETLAILESAGREDSAAVR
ncbi:MAG TPA: glycosyltransferase, partial [Vicinamibacterales bacterium]|nr:glycosyltransferase [Vicinamibacterales bacterium]